MADGTGIFYRGMHMVSVLGCFLINRAVAGGSNILRIQCHSRGVRH